MTSVLPTISLIKLAKQQIRILARSIVPAVSYWVGTNGFLLIAIRRSESMFAALDDWIPSGEAKKCWLVVFWKARPALRLLAFLGASVTGEISCPGATCSTGCRPRPRPGFETEHSRNGLRPCWRRSRMKSSRDRDGYLSRNGTGSAASLSAVVAIWISFHGIEFG